jgi:hypothetical protein
MERIRNPWSSCTRFTHKALEDLTNPSEVPDSLLFTILALKYAASGKVFDTPALPIRHRLYQPTQQADFCSAGH